METNRRSSLVKDIATRFREARFGNRSENMPSLRLLGLLDDESIPVERNIFDSSPAHEFMEELSHKANSFVAKLLFTTLSEKAFLRHQAPPNSRRLQTFVERMTRLGYDIDPSSSGSLQTSLVQIEDLDIRKVLELISSSSPFSFLANLSR
jgi:protein SSD1